MQIGDIVYLNSGRPELKVVSLRGEHAIVEWLNEENVLSVEDFPIVALSYTNNPKWVIENT